MSSTPLKGETTIVPAVRAAQAVARRTAEARATVPDLELGAELDAAPVVAAAARAGDSLTAVLVAACARALRAHPRANAAYRDGQFELYSRVNVAVMVATEDGYATPTLLDADTRPASELADELAALTERARRRALTPPEQAGATFTLLDYGPGTVARPGVMVIPPQAAALGVGSVRPAPVLAGDTVVPGHLLGLTLACDARILFGARAAAFLGSIVDALAS